MSYGDFTLNEVLSQFSLRANRAPLFGSIAPLTPGTWLLDWMARAKSQPLINEKTRSEMIIAPVLFHGRDFVGENFGLYSGIELNADPAAGLKGVCDFVVGGAPPLPELQAPLLVVVEAKRGDIEAATGQCAAQMLGARAFNTHWKSEVPAVYGCITTGTDWQFLRLAGNALTIDSDQYFLTDLGKILGILVWIVTVGSN